VWDIHHRSKELCCCNAWAAFSRLPAPSRANVIGSPISHAHGPTLVVAGSESWAVRRGRRPLRFRLLDRCRPRARVVQGHHGGRIAIPHSGAKAVEFTLVAPNLTRGITVVNGLVGASDYVMARDGSALTVVLLHESSGCRCRSSLAWCGGGGRRPGDRRGVAGRRAAAGPALRRVEEVVTSRNDQPRLHTERSAD
jgi:hypothetical protein